LKNKAKQTSELTKKQSLVMNLLSGTKGPLTAYNILYDLRDHGFRGPTQVYRVLEKLLEIGMVHRIESKNAFVACQQEKCYEKNNEINLFTICEICGSVQELLNNGLKNLVKSLSKDKNFLLKNSVLELNGVCSKCKD
tara:strand:+ start:263 stop:676 length:414 start_codon:yes stop_codon:yes gene_type:complete